MASTNKTTNYDLSQYIGSDKPTYLSDYNSDMYKIDAQMKVNADNVATAISSASTATSTANSANSTAQSALSTAQSASSTASQASTTAGNAQSTANSALATATSAQTTANTAEANVEKFNLTTFTPINKSDTTSSNVVSDYVVRNMYVATNDEGSIFKLYGEVFAELINYNQEGTISFSTNIRPTTNLTINFGCSCVFVKKSTGAINAIRGCGFSINTNGVVSLRVPNFAASDETKQITYFSCLYFAKDFGDTPIQE